jgi:tetratricopeptide (TPR) repeat protein
MYVYTKVMVLRLTCIITFCFILFGCSSVILPKADKVAVPGSKTEEQLLAQGLNDYRQGEFSMALEKSQAVLTLNPDNVEAMYAMATSYLALDEFKKSLKYSRLAASYASLYLADIYLLMGSAYERMDDPWNALRTYRSAASKYPANSKIHYHLAKTYVYLNKLEFAAESFKAAIRADSRNVAAHFELGVLYYEHDYITPTLLSLSAVLLMEPKQGPVFSIQEYISDLLARKELNVMETDEGDFRSVDAALLASRSSLYNSGKQSTFDIIKAQYLAFYVALNAETIKEQKNIFVVDSYVPLFNEIYLQGLAETSVYYIFQENEDKTIASWLDKQPVKVKQLEQLVKNHVW